jgi:hypothetical protein
MFSIFFSEKLFSFPIENSIFVLALQIPLSGHKLIAHEEDY